MCGPHDRCHGISASVKKIDCGASGSIYLPDIVTTISGRLNMSVTVMTPDQCRAARALLHLTQAELGQAAGVGKQVIVDYERQARRTRAQHLAAITQALEAAGIVFIGDTGLKLRKPRKSRPVTVERDEARGAAE